MITSLLELADELILSCIDQINDIETLRNLALTCSRLRALVEPAIYRDIFIRRRRDVLALEHSIVRRPHRLLAIQGIDSRHHYASRDFQFHGLINIVRRAPNLQKYTIESPFCNHVQSSARFGWAESMQALLRPICDFSLPRLTSLTLHLSLEDKRYWHIDQSNALLFAHPTLRSLKLSCATLEDNVPTRLEDRPKTPLKQLTLIECNISQKALTAILALPASLEELSLGEPCSHWNSTIDRAHNFNDLFNQDAIAFFGSLSQQQHSLRSLAYAAKCDALVQTRMSRPLKLSDVDCTGLANFHSLRDLDLGGHCYIEFAKLLISPVFAPPALERLSANEGWLSTFVNATEDIPENQIPQLPDIHAHNPHLKLIELTVRRIHKDTSTPYFEPIATTLKDKDVVVRIFQLKSTSAVPPFLFGERPYSFESRFSLHDGRVFEVSEAEKEIKCLQYS